MTGATMTQQGDGWWRRNWKKAAGCGCAAVVLLGVAAGIAAWLGADALREAKAGFDRDADIVRLRHLEHYVGAIEDHVDATGHAPLQGVSDAPVYVHVSRSGRLPRGYERPPYEHAEVALEEFLRVLEEGLGREVERVHDPQFAPAGAPTFYVYKLVGDTWYFAVHLARPHPFAKQLGPRYWKLEVSNHPTPENGALDPDALFESAAFRAAVETPLEKPDFFETPARR